MKKIFIFFIVMFFSLVNLVFADVKNDNNITGRWAEKISERVVMDIFANQNNTEFQIFITWREDNLAQKDIYRFRGKLDNNGNIEYKDGIHIYRYFDKQKTEDKIDYTDGRGIIKINNYELVWIDNKDKTTTEFIRANEDLLKDTTIQNGLFSITLPEELKGLYEVKKEKNKISIYHINSKKAGFGGFAFGIKAYENPSDHAVLPGSRKIGELRGKYWGKYWGKIGGRLYDIVLKHPTDVQYDYTKGVNPPEAFKLLYEIGDVINVSGVNGSTYYKNQGMKGEDLYKEVLQKHRLAINEKWDSTKLEKENMSYMYNVIEDKSKIGYVFYDVNVDGIDELLIGEIAQGDWKGVIYDIYTMVNREPKHVISGGARDRYYVCDGSFVCNEYSSGALESGVRVYNLVENSTELYPQVSFKYDGYTNPKKPWFLSYSDNQWENVSEKTYEERKKVFDKYERFDFIPLNKFKTGNKLEDKYSKKKDYFDYSSVISEFPKNYYYTTVKINKSKERILIVTDKIDENKNANYGLFYYIANNSFVYPLGYLESNKPLSVSENYFYLNDKKFYISDKKFAIASSQSNKKEGIQKIEFDTIESAEKFAGDFGSPAGNDIKKVVIDGFYFEYHKGQYKREYVKNLMKECIKDGVKTQVQMYCCMVKKLHP